MVLRPNPTGGYVLVAGERRWRAARRAGLTEIPAMIRTGDDAASLTEALVENLQRSDLTPLEEAAAYQQLLEDFGMTHDEVGQTGREEPGGGHQHPPPAWVCRPRSRAWSKAGSCRPVMPGRWLGSTTGPSPSTSPSERWTRAGAFARSKRPCGSGKGRTLPRRPRVREVRPAEIIELEMRLADRLGSKVKVDFKGGRGAMQIDFGSLEELERLYRRLMG